MMLRPLLALSLLLAPALAGAQALSPEQARIRAHVAFLASDEMRGRAPGSPEFDKATDYVVAQMKALGLTPAGVGGGWFQPVPLVSYKPAAPATLGFTRGGTRAMLDPATDFAGIADPRTPDRNASGELVFVGYGVIGAAGEAGDYAGLDVSGKIVAIVHPGAGAERQEPDLASRVRTAYARGATGVIIVEPTKGLPPFAVLRGYFAGERVTTLDAEGNIRRDFDVTPPLGLLSSKGAEKLFAGSTIDWAAVVAAQQSGAKLPTGATGAMLDYAMKTEVGRIASRNVVGVLEGSDPALKGQYLALSAHLDHLGVGKADASGDTIYNGAMDNAFGVASVLEVARDFQKSGKRPRRSILFLALTGEEKGLLGSDYFARNPTVPKQALVGDINLDMPILTYPLVDVVATGEEHSSLGPTLAAVAKSVGLSLVPDPFPEENFFVRSDHYSFVQQGVPALSVDTGPGGEGKAAMRDFLDKHYHKPSDQLTLPINWDSAAKYVALSYALMRTLADADARPSWNKGDRYGVMYDGYGAK